MARDLAQLLEQYGADAEKTGDAMLAASPTYVAQPTQTHVNLVNMLDEILSLATMTQGGHPMLRASLRTVKHLKPVALEELASVPEDEVREFMRRLSRMLLRAIGDEEGPGANHGAPANGAGPIEPSPAGAGPIGGGDPGRQVNAG